MSRRKPEPQPDLTGMNITVRETASVVAEKQAASPFKAVFTAIDTIPFGKCIEITDVPTKTLHAIQHEIWRVSACNSEDDYDLHTEIEGDLLRIWKRKPRQIIVTARRAALVDRVRELAAELRECKGEATDA